MIRIGQYLKKTRTQGIIYKPFDSTHLEMDVHVDSDFLGIYGKELRTDPDNVKSRMGYVISLNSCPIIWASKLMEQIALSTMMAEYYALSQAMREVLPFRDLIRVVSNGIGIDEACATEFKTTIWEDNNGCLHLANMDPGQYTSRSRHYDCRVHWFRSHLKDSVSDDVKSDPSRPSGPMTVERIDTKAQLADIFTKPLDPSTFKFLRQKLMVWNDCDLLKN